MTKDEWAEAAIRGDEAALLYRIDMDKAQLYGIAYCYLRNEADALEAVQETVCRIWAKRHTLKEPRYFTTWAVRILIRVCMDERKKRNREVPFAEYVNPPQTDSRQEETAQRVDMAAQVQQLPPKYRMVIALKYYRDMTITEIAELLEKPDGTVRTWLNKALKALRSDMADAKEAEGNEQRAGNGAGAGRTMSAKR